MRLLIFSSEFPPGPGGIGVHAYQIARHLATSGWKTRVISLQDYAAESEILAFNQQLPFPVTRLVRTSQKLPSSIYNRLRVLSDALQEFHPDILLASGESSVWLTACHALLPNTSSSPWIAVWHGVVPPSPAKRKLSCWAYGQADTVIAVSHYGYERLLDMGVKPKNGCVIHNGADHNLFCPLPENRWKDFRQRYVPPDAEVLLTVGHVTERKGQELVVRALPMVLARRPNVHYWMVGLPTIQPELEKLAINLGIKEHVHFLGRLNETDLLSAYNACDVFIMTSRHSQEGQFEGYGIAAVEAAFCGKPAIVSDNSGLLEAILPGETGLVVRENDPSSIAVSILILLGNEPMRRQMGENARQRALISQTWDSCANKYDQVFQNIPSRK